ncbi:MAG: putative peroxidase-related enzyme [Candidatus Krumholzibacteriia bacterium]|jgi:uncharacterized peroxidase-related enzyme
MKFPIHTAKTVAPPANAQLQAVQESLGFVPNLFGVIAESAPALQAFMALNNEFSQSSLTALEREIVQVVASVENDCAYCVAGHTAFANLQELPADPIEAARGGYPLADPKLAALQRFTIAAVKNRGHVDPMDLLAFKDAGYGPAQVLEVVLGVCVKFFSNLTNNIVGIPLDEEFESFAWLKAVENSSSR